MAVLCPAAEARSHPAQPEQRPGPAEVTVLGAAHVRFGRVAMFNTGWQCSFEATSEAKPWHRERLQPNYHPMGGQDHGRGRERWSSRDISPAPLTQLLSLCR